MQQLSYINVKGLCLMTCLRLEMQLNPQDLKLPSVYNVAQYNHNLLR